MNLLFFEDNEMDLLIQAVNQYQFIFHPIFAPNGTFTNENVLKLQNPENKIMIIADKNIISPICELAKNGTLKNQERMLKIAVFITFVKSINATITCGLGLMEDETSKLTQITGEESRQLFLHAIDKIPAIIWKQIAFGEIEAIPDAFLFQNLSKTQYSYDYSNGLHFLYNEASMIKIVKINREKDLTKIQKFDKFMRWYADNLDIAESMMLYSAMVFADIAHVSKPKYSTSTNYEKVIKGIKNQAWDMTYITIWSTEYYDEKEKNFIMFATDDLTQKTIVINIIPKGQVETSLLSIFTTKSEQNVLEKLYEEKFGSARKRPFIGKTNSEIKSIVYKLINAEYEDLKNSLNNQ